MTDHLAVRRTTANDGALIRQLRISVLTDAPYAFGAKLEAVLAEPLSAFEVTALCHAESETSTSFIALIDGNPVGMIGAFHEPQSQRNFICALWLEPRHRGTSIAAELVNTAVSWLRQHSEQAVFAWVADANLRARAFYQKLGFVTTEMHQPLPSCTTEYETLLSLDNLTR